MNRLPLCLAAALTVALSGCGGGDKAPAGQVVATVNGEEITANELKQELGDAKAPNAKAQKELEKAALRSLVNRRLLVQAAKEQKVDATPAFAMQKRRLEDVAIIQALEAKIAATVPAPTREEAERYVAEHPASFAERRLLAIDQLVVPTAPPAITQQMRPLTTLPQIAEMLTRNKIAFQRGQGVIDTATLAPEQASQILALPPGEPFVVGSGGGLLVNLVRDSRVEPLVGPKAVEVALQQIRARRTREIVGRQFETLTRDGAAKVQYNADYAPAPTTPPKAK